MCDKSFMTHTQGRFPAPLIKCPKLNFVRDCPVRLTTLQVHVYIYRLMHRFVFNSLNLILIGNTRCLCLVFSVAYQKIILQITRGKSNEVQFYKIRFLHKRLLERDSVWNFTAVRWFCLLNINENIMQIRNTIIYYIVNAQVVDL